MEIQEQGVSEEHVILTKDHNISRSECSRVVLCFRSLCVPGYRRSVSGVQTGRVLEHQHLRLHLQVSGCQEWLLPVYTYVSGWLFQARISYSYLTQP